MRNQRFGLIIVIIVMSLFSQTIGVSPAAGQDSSTPAAVSLVIQTNNKALVRRAGWTAYSSLSLGAVVQFGDLIDPKGQPVRILCPDLSEQAVTKLGPVPCPRERPVLVQKGQALAGWQRGAPLDLSIPFLITPRASAVSTAQPVIQWNAVPGVDGYRVTVRGEGLTWSTEITGDKNNKLTYPKNAPPLKPKVAYTVEIVEISGGIDGRSSMEEDTPGMSFTVLAPQEAANVQKVAATIRSSVKDKGIADLVVAYYYGQIDLRAEAIQLLTGISGDLLDKKARSTDPLTDSPRLYLTLGDLFADSKVQIYATAAYNRVVELAAKRNDVESQAMALTGLARLSTDKDKQAEYVAGAIKLWNQLGAQQQVEALEKEFSQ